MGHMNTDDLYNEPGLTKVQVKQRFKIYDYDLLNLGVQTLKGRKNKVPVYELIRKLKIHYDKTKQLSEGQGTDFEIVNIEKSLAREKVLSLKISNQRVLNQLISKDSVKQRVEELLHHYTELIETYIEEISESYTPVEPRKNKEKLTELFNELFDQLIDDKAKIISWEEDGEVDLLATRIMASQSAIKDAEQTLSKVKSSMASQ